MKRAPRARARVIGGALLLVVVVLGGRPSPAGAEDTDQLRFYWALRLGLSLLTDAHATGAAEADARQQLTGMSLGANLGRYLSLEVAGDVYETELRGAGGRKLGEYGMLSLIPQVRLRYPVLAGRLTPYVVGGVGIAHNEFNDRKPLAVGMRVRANDTSAAGSIGAGLEYFLAGNVAVGVEARYLISQDQEIDIAGHREKASLNAVLAAASLRVLFPETPAVAIRPAPSEPAPNWGLYVGLRVGGVVAIPKDIGGGLSAQHENAAVGEASQTYAAAVGADLGRHVSIEMTVSGWEGNLRLKGVGTIEEYAVYSFMPVVRLRLPLREGRLVPYLLAGAGAGWHETNDGKPAGAGLDATGKDWGYVGVVGAGLDYFVARNIAVGVESAYHLSRGHRMALVGRGHDLELNWLSTTLGLRLYFAGTGRP